MRMRLAPLLPVTAALLAACGLSLRASPVERIEPGLTGEVIRTCGPADGPGLHFNLQTPDGLYEFDFSLWAPMPETVTEYPMRAAGVDTHSGEACLSGECFELERLRLTLSPGTPGPVTGTILITGGQDVRLQADFQAEFLPNPDLLCG